MKYVIAFCLGALSIKGSAQLVASREYQIKAAFLFNFTQFVEWSEGTFKTPDSPFLIGILGDDPFGTAIDEAVEGEAVLGHPITVQRFSTLQEIKDCQILFVSKTQEENIEDITEIVKDKKTLTVSDIPGFPLKGGMIGFLMENNKTKLQINPAIAKAADVNISSKLLRLADIVGPK